MVIYLDIVMLLNFLVDWLLLMGTNRLLGHSLSPGRCALAALVGGLYGGACLLPGFSFLGNTLWRTVMLALLAVIAYGLKRSTIRRGVLFLLLSMALGGVAMGLDRGFLSVVGAAGGVCLLCNFGFRGRMGGESYLPVELIYGETRLHLTALQDTGNTLCDPITGSPVLVVDSETAGKLTGLSKEQLQKPVESIGAIPGLRLIPYRAVGTENGLLLALPMKQVKIGSWRVSRVVAFAPEQLSVSGEYQALTGGAA